MQPETLGNFDSSTTDDWREVFRPGARVDLGSGQSCTLGLAQVAMTTRKRSPSAIANRTKLNFRQTVYRRCRTDGLNGRRERLADHAKFREEIPAISRLDLVIAILSRLAVFALISALIADAFR